jgi:hypothetical protein
MTSYEQLGLFYLGRRYDLASRTRLPEPLLYDSRDLLTHAVCVGMTGSGKTGLGIGLIEEAAIDGIPVLAIDPKGDLGNLLLTFPNLAPEDFAPWVTASPGGTAPAEAVADEQARLWREGLAEWDQPPERLARLRAAVDVRIYTPGSRAGTPLAVLNALRAPSPGEDAEDAAARISSTAAGLMALAGVGDSGPHAREHALLSAILASAPSSADFPWLVQQIQRPSFSQIGVLDLETFYPARDRQELALRFNSVLATPGFDVWLSGDPLDVGQLLYTPEGGPRVAIVSIAHLGDAERMLVVSMLLNAAVQWTRRQTGTPSLRAMIYMDEVFGFLPPVANPPSKLPLLTLLKQARAFGVGIVLATQNPVDLDYKALSNTGTWFLGKLQTQRDKDRVLDGIEGLSSAMDRQSLDQTLSALQRRVFLLHNVHEPQPMLFETRWTLSYLRGPMSRDEIRRAVAARERDGRAGSEPQAAAAASAAPVPSAAAARPPEARPASGGPPVLPAGVSEAFLPAAGTPGHYAPVLYGAARVHYTDARRRVDHAEDLHAVVSFSDGPVPVDWARAVAIDCAPEALRERPADAGAARYAPLPAAALQPKSYAGWSREFEAWIMRTQPLTLLAAPSFKVVSAPGESERDFRIRLQQAAHEARDAAVETLRARYAPKVQRVTDRLRAAEDAVGRERAQADQQKLQSAVSIGATMLGALLGRRAVSVSTLGRATTAARGVSRSMKETQDIARAEERAAALRQELQALEAELEKDVAALSAGAGEAPAVEKVEIKPKRGGVTVRLVTLAWKPEP